MAGSEDGDNKSLSSGRAGVVSRETPAKPLTIQRRFAEWKIPYLRIGRNKKPRPNLLGTRHGLLVLKF
jgi:hypothetical protein